MTRGLKTCLLVVPRARFKAVRLKGIDYADRSVMAQSIMQTITAAGRKLTAVCFCATLAGALSGCGMSSITSGLGSSIFGGSGAPGAEQQGVSEEQLLAAAKSGDGSAVGLPSDVSPGCPRFTVWPRDNHLTIYEAGRAGDGLAIVHRGEITKTSRECVVNGNSVTVRYGFSGRVLLGPKGKTGPLTLPINVFVTDAKRDKIATDRLQVDTTLAVENPIGYFSAVRTVTFAVPEGARAGEFEVFVGFERNTPNAG